MTYTRSLSDPAPQTVPRTENDALIEVATMSTEPNQLESGKIYGWMSPTGDVRTIDLTGDQYRDHPRRKTGTTNVRDVESFGQYWDKHANLDHAEVYADDDRDTVTAILDAHGSTTPGWAAHRLVYTLRRTHSWQIWTQYDGKLMGQTEFAELLEANLPDIAEPDGADLLELAQTFSATTSASFRSGNILANGARELVYSENIEASGGRGGKTIAIPKHIVLAVAPYEGTVSSALTARFRYRIHEGNLRLGYVLDRPHELRGIAFGEVLDDIETRIRVQIMRGRPA